MIFLKARDLETGRQIILNLKYVVKIWETDVTYKIGIAYTYGKNSVSAYIDKRTTKFMEMNKPEEAIGFLSEEDMRVE